MYKMLNLKYILFLLLISFTFQFDHCYQEAKICQKKIPKTVSGSVANCVKYEKGDDDICEKCAWGYALSYEGDKCIQFSYCKYLLEGNKECDECYEGYYLNGKECTKIPIDNCLSLEDDGTHCDQCADYSKINSDRTQCKLIEKRIEGCIYYDDNGDCSYCEDDYTQSGSGSSFKCTFNGCTGDQVVNYCSSCEIGYYTDESDGNCKPYPTGNSNNSGRNKIRCALFMLMLGLLV